MITILTAELAVLALLIVVLGITQLRTAMLLTSYERRLRNRLVSLDRQQAANDAYLWSLHHWLADEQAGRYSDQVAAPGYHLEGEKLKDDQRT